VGGGGGDGYLVGTNVITSMDHLVVHSQDKWFKDF
jgi:hypothetical protein